jgi:uncharacterized protein YuzE
MSLGYDPEADAAYLRLRVATVASTEEIAPGVLMDLAADGRPVGFELLHPSETLGRSAQGVTFELLSRAWRRTDIPRTSMSVKDELLELVDQLDEEATRADVRREA